MRTPAALVPALALILLVAAPAAAAAGVRSVTLAGPRPFGLFIGDAILLEADIVADPGFRVMTASLPRPGPVTYWLDLRSVAVEDGGVRDGAGHHRVRLEYQTFYAPLEPRALDIPSLTLTLNDGARSAEAVIPAWTFLTSPLRELRSGAGGDGGGPYLRPDVPPRPVDGTVGMLAAAGSGTALPLLLALNAWHRGWWPFRARARRPFMRALRVARLDLQMTGDAGAYRAALLAFHRAFDAAAGRRVLGDDVPVLLDAVPAFRPLRADIERFFEASRLAFFGADTAAAIDRLPPAALLALGRRLTAAEREAG
ncbi:hypothetical protein [Azospirillum halopraeferens]|uniref:hypothetical protein n=1 Tax=Azospirillum halopraeferens TaxID=34010 RepID=UPI0003FA3142|nr:hypothetical protein [Azospirillum halopraeferens]